MKRGRKPTAAMPKPGEYAYRCEVVDADGRYVCPPGPDGRPLRVGGFASQADVDAGLSKHYYVAHNAGV